MKYNETWKNMAFITLLIQIALFAVDMYFMSFLPIYFIIILIANFFISLILFTREIIHKEKIRFFTLKIIAIIVALVTGYADFYFQLSRSYLHVFKDDIALSAIDSLYFSISTFTTTGYGDIYPISTSAKMFAASEMVLGYIVSSFVVAILVTKFLDEKN